LLLHNGETVKIATLDTEESQLPVYNIHVAQLENYSVGFSGILVHNTNDPPAPSRMPRADRFPARDVSGRIHGEIPSSVPRNWRAGEIRDAIAEVEGSLAQRRGNQAIFGPGRGHDVRVVQEEQWLRQLQRRLEERW
jgi:hypothetical protein